MVRKVFFVCILPLILSEVKCALTTTGWKDCEPFSVILPIACGIVPKEGGETFGSKPDHAIFMHTAGRSCHSLVECCNIIADLTKYQVKELGWTDIGSNFLIGGDGRVYVGRGWRTVGQFSLRYNKKSLGIAFIGNFYVQNPPGKAVTTASRFLDCAVTKGYLTRNYTIHMHEDIECTRNPAPALQEKIAPFLHYQKTAKDYVKCFGH